MSAPIALQLWSIQDETAKDFKSALAAVAKMGYNGVEFAGYGGISAEAMKELLDSLGLKAAGSHVGLDALRENLDEQIAYNKTIGNKYIVCPYAKCDTAEEWEALAEELAEYSKKIRAAGLMLGYHNHAHELDVFDGKYALDYILTPSSDIICELDTYWTEYAGIDTVKYLDQLGARCKLVHLKDMAEKESGEKYSCTYGEGILDHKTIIRAGLKNNPDWLVIEWEEFVGSSLDAVDRSLRNLRGLLAEI